MTATRLDSQSGASPKILNSLQSRFSSPRTRAMLALAAAGLFWGTSDVGTSIALDALPPITLAALRFCVAILVLLPFARGKSMPSFLNIRIAVLGIFGVAGMYLFQNAGLQQTAAANASMLQGAGPIFILIGSLFFLKESLGRARLIGVLLAFGGIFALTSGSFDGLSRIGQGDLYIIGSALCFAFFVLFGRSLFATHGTIPVLLVSMVWSLVVLLPMSAVEVSTTGVGHITGGTLAIVLYLGAGCSALTYALWGFALTHLQAGHAAIFDNLVPVVGVISATVIFRHQPTALELFGGALIITGAWLASRPEEIPVLAPVPLRNQVLAI